jgi:predicted ATPase
MKLKRLEVEGYKSLKHVVWEPGDLNVLIGPNGSGKSNLLRLLEMLSASARGELDKFIQGEGGIGPLLWDSDAKEISIDIIFTSLDDKKREIETKYEFKLVPQRNWNYTIVENEKILQKISEEHGENVKKMLLVQSKHVATILGDHEEIIELHSKSDRETILSQLPDKSQVPSQLLEIIKCLSDAAFYLSPYTSYNSAASGFSMGTNPGHHRRNISQS